MNFLEYLYINKKILKNRIDLSCRTKYRMGETSSIQNWLFLFEIEDNSNLAYQDD